MCPGENRGRGGAGKGRVDHIEYELTHEKGIEIDEPDKPSPWCVYVLRCSDSSFYTGVTNSLKKRLLAHREGKGSRYVKSRSPFVVARIIGCRDEHEARSLEYRLKRMTRSGKASLLGLHKAPARDPGGDNLDPDIAAHELMPVPIARKRT